MKCINCGDTEFTYHADKRVYQCKTCGVKQPEVIWAPVYDDYAQGLTPIILEAKSCQRKSR